MAKGSTYTQASNTTNATILGVQGGVTKQFPASLLQGTPGASGILAVSSITSNTTAASNTHYIVSNSSNSNTVDVTLPSSPAIGDIVKVSGLYVNATAKGFRILCASGHYINHIVKQDYTYCIYPSKVTDTVELVYASSNNWKVINYTTYPSTDLAIPPPNYYGDGSDGVINTNANVNIASALDGAAQILQYSSFTLNAGHTFTVTNRCKGLIIYVKGDCTINGTLTMTSKGSSGAGPTVDQLLMKAFVDPVQAGTSAIDSTTPPLISEVASNWQTIENNQTLAITNRRKITLSKTGGAVGAGAVRGSNAIGPTAGQTGQAGITGGGGNGGASYYSSNGLGQTGTLWCGGAGGGGETGGTWNASYSNGDAPSANGAGGNAYRNAGGVAGGGAGNSGGTGAGGGATGGGGGGGLLILMVQGNLTIGSGALVSSDGGAGGNGIGNDANGCSGGGGAGGGCVIVLYRGTLSNAGTIRANGGAGGTGTNSGDSSRQASGGAGGNGTTLLANIL